MHTESYIKALSIQRYKLRSAFFSLFHAVVGSETPAGKRHHQGLYFGDGQNLKQLKKVRSYSIKGFFFATV